MRLLPFLEGLDRGDMAEGLLRQVLVVEPDVAVQRRRHVGPRLLLPRWPPTSLSLPAGDACFVEDNRHGHDTTRDQVYNEAGQQYYEERYHERVV